MKIEEVQSAELACSKLCNQFAVFNDAGRHEELVALFTENGGYARPTDPANFIAGKEAILAAFKSRPQDKITRHLITNIIVDLTGEQTARGICYVTLFSGSTNIPADKFGFKANSSVLIGEYHDEFVLTESGWRFNQRGGRLILST